MTCQLGAAGSCFCCCVLARTSLTLNMAGRQPDVPYSTFGTGCSLSVIWLYSGCEGLHVRMSNTQRFQDL